MNESELAALSAKVDDLAARVQALEASIATPEPVVPVAEATLAPAPEGTTEAVNAPSA